MKALNILRNPNISLAINFLYAIGNCIVGLLGIIMLIALIPMIKGIK